MPVYKEGDTLVYAIKNSVGTTIAEHVRKDREDGKRMSWRRYYKFNEAPYYSLGNLKPSDLPLYGSERVSGWEEDRPIIITEGEKAAESLLERGYHALGTVTGSSGLPGPIALSVLQDREVILWPDNDDVGREHMGKLAMRLEGVASSLRWVDSPADSPKGWDAADSEDPDPLIELAWEMSESDLGGGEEEPPEDKPERLYDIISKKGPPSPDKSWACQDVWKPGSLTLVLGTQQSFKSWAMLDLMVRALSGEPWLGHDIPKAFDAAVYVTNEKSPAAVYERAFDVFGDRLDLARSIYWRDRSAGIRFGTEKWDEFVEWLHTSVQGRVLLILDTLTSLAPPGYDENSMQHVSGVLEAIRYCHDDDRIDVMLVHHMGASGFRARGHTSLDGEVDGFINLSRQGMDTDDVLVRMNPKDGAMSAMLWEFDTTAWTFTKRGTKAMSSPFTWVELAKEFHERNDDWPTRNQLQKVYFGESYAFTRDVEVGIRRAEAMGLVKRVEYVSAITGQPGEHIVVKDEGDIAFDEELQRIAARVRTEVESRQLYEEQRDQLVAERLQAAAQAATESMESV